jgi:ferredoxin
VDADRCEGHGLCEQTAPDVFRLDEDGITHPLYDEPPGHLISVAEAAVRMCPVAALRIER